MDHRQTRVVGNRLEIECDDIRWKKLRRSTRKNGDAEVPLYRFAEVNFLNNIFKSLFISRRRRRRRKKNASSYLNAARTDEFTELTKGKYDDASSFNIVSNFTNSHSQTRNRKQKNKNKKKTNKKNRFYFTTPANIIQISPTDCLSFSTGENPA